MIYINLAIVVLIMLLAVMSRKYKSKYKARGGSKFINYILVMGDLLGNILNFNYEKLGKLYRKIYVLPEGREKDHAKDFVSKILAFCLLVALISNSVVIVHALLGRKENVNSNSIIRDDYDGYQKTYKVRIKKDEQEEIYSLKVSPVEYTKDEFMKQCEEVYLQLEESILGDNEDLQHINHDLYLPASDKSGLFHIDWTSNQPEIINADGRLHNLDLSMGQDVLLVATISYLEYETDLSYSIHVDSVKEVESAWLELAKKEIDEYEVKGRNSRELDLPKNIDGIDIDVINEKGDVRFKLIAIGLCVCFLFVGLQCGGLYNKVKTVDSALSKSYVSFVDSLSLLIGSGMTIKGAIVNISNQTHLYEKLSKELKYAVNMIDSGYGEAYVYEQLGLRIGLPEYVKLFSYISQNLKKGNENLDIIMKNCTYEATQICKEQIKKKGEITSTKLLFPMILLLIVVMLIIIIPAMLNF